MAAPPRPAKKSRKAAAASKRAPTPRKAARQAAASSEPPRAADRKHPLLAKTPKQAAAPAPETPGERKHPLLQRWIEKIRGTFWYAVLARFIEIDLMAQSAALSLYALISLAPLLLLVLWLTASLLPSAQDALLAQIADLAGSGAREVAATVLEHADRRPDLRTFTGAWNTALLFVAATVVFAHLQATLNLIFATDAATLRGGVLGWLRKRVFSFGVVFALGFLLLVSMTLTTVVQVAFAWLPALVPALANAVSLALYALAFALLYHWLPDRRVAWRMAFLGGAITAALFVLGRWAIGQYVAYAAPGSAYGSFATLVIMLVWMYYAALVFFIGALITAVVDERVRGRATAAAPGNRSRAGAAA